MLQLSSIYRTHTCGEINESHAGQTVRLSGWIHRVRDHGGILFVDLRDNYGITQVITSMQEPRIARLTKDKYQEIIDAPYESVVTFTGNVVLRDEDARNPKIYTGGIEVIAEDFSILSRSENKLPIQVNSDAQCPEETRLEYRFLDLRRENIHEKMILRSKVIAKLREMMHAEGFYEYTTPILTASSPEGARDFLVPSRLHRGKFYALPQAPQQFKQLLMIAGFDRYFQIAPCFRDEDARADRAPGEFYQLDLEMSFVEQEDVFTLGDRILSQLFSTFAQDGSKVSKTPFERVTYSDAMLRYGSDKPDLRNPLEIFDVTDIASESQCAIFVNAIKAGNIVRAIQAPRTSSLPRSFFDGMISFAQSEAQAKGLAYITFEGNSGKGPIAKFFTTEQLSALQSKCKINDGDSIFFVCDSKIHAPKIAGKVRQKLGENLNLIDQNEYRFCWITDFPFYELNESTNEIDFSHNPFSMPQGGLQALLDAEGDTNKLLDIKAYQYDIVCNGIELSSGAIRNHLPEIMYKAFEIVGHSKEYVDQNFGGMIKAFRYGAPPHGGMAPGIDRMVMLLAKEDNIREVILFPLNQRGQDLLMNAPSEVTEKQLAELGITLRPTLKDK